MSKDDESGTRYNRKRTLWGVILIAAGVLFLLDQMDIYHVGGIWHLWPFAIAIAGLVEILSARRFKDVTRGLLNIVFGIWIYASLEHLWDWTFSNSWPVLMIAFGASVVLNGLAQHFQQSKTESLQ